MVNDRLVLGTVQFGLTYGVNNAVGKPSQDQAFGMLDLAFENGITTLDTADAYGNATEVLGNYNQKHPGRFEINSKFKGHSSDLELQLEASLGLLKSDHLNVYFYHNFTDFVSYPALQETLGRLKDSGKIKKVGVSVYDNDEFKTVCDSSWVDVIQLPYNLLDNYSQRGEILEYAKKQGKELQARSVYLQGLFFKPLDTIPAALSPLTPYLQRIREIAAASGISVQRLAMGYALQQSLFDNIVFGVDSIEQLDATLKMSEETIPQDIIQLVDSIVVKETELLYPKNW